MLYKAAYKPWHPHDCRTPLADMSLRKNTIWNLIGSGSPLLGAAVCIPYTLQQLGVEGFGVLTLIWALIGYFSLFDFGTGRALTYEVSKILSESDKNLSTSIAEVLKAGLLLTLITGLLGCGIIFVFSPKLAESWLKISPAWQENTKFALQITAIGVIPATLTSGLRGAMEGLGQFKESNLYKTLLGLCMFALPAIAIHFHGVSLSKIAFYLVSARAVIMIACIVQLRAYFIAPLAKTDSNSNAVWPLKGKFAQLFSFGFWVTVTGIVSPLMVFGDRFFISAMLGADKLSVYAIPQEGLMRVLMVPTAICGALLPIFTSSKITTQLVDVYQINYRRMVKIMASLCILAAILVFPVLSLWISREFAESASIIAFILILGTFINGIALVPYTLLHSMGKTKITAQFHIAELFIYIAIMYVFTQHFGLYGAAIAWVIRVYIDWVLLHFAGKRALGT
ncbi:flippase [Undibacterium danionis]|uniref:Flippase n=1 Tax=Undibacterium danionis TaxID=1812100 RepID=A0ABV6IGL5_9BURK